ncbi:hypothetical protein ABQE57_22230 [Mycolicibacterium elephantis]
MSMKLHAIIEKYGLDFDLRPFDAIVVGRAVQLAADIAERMTHPDGQHRFNPYGYGEAVADFEIGSDGIEAEDCIAAPVQLPDELGFHLNIFISYRRGRDSVVVGQPLVYLENLAMAAAQARLVGAELIEAGQSGLQHRKQEVRLVVVPGCGGGG